MTTDAQRFNIEAARVNRGLSRRDLAEELGVGQETVRLIENGHRPSPRIGKKFADFFECSVTDLWPIEQEA